MQIKISLNDYDSVLLSILKEQTIEQLLQIPGIYEILSEHYDSKITEILFEETPED